MARHLFRPLPNVSLKEALNGDAVAALAGTAIPKNETTN